MSQRELFSAAIPRIGEVEERLRAQGIENIIGVDEAGRGPLAGPVHAAAFWLDLSLPLSEQLDGLDDSKKLDEPRREALFEQLQLEDHPFAIVPCEAGVIDEINILQATFRAMTRAVDAVIAAVGSTPDLVLIDGNMVLPDSSLAQQAIVKGDARSLAIAAASILAKVSRDRFMRSAHQKWPQYSFHTNKGYGTAAHRRALRDFGPCELHRLTFAGVLPQGTDATG